MRMLCKEIIILVGTHICNCESARRVLCHQVCLLELACIPRSMYWHLGHYFCSLVRIFFSPLRGETDISFICFRSMDNSILSYIFCSCKWMLGKKQCPMHWPTNKGKKVKPKKCSKIGLLWPYLDGFWREIWTLTTSGRPNFTLTIFGRHSISSNFPPKTVKIWSK